MKNGIKLIFGLSFLVALISHVSAQEKLVLSPEYVLNEVAKASSIVKSFSADLYQVNLAVSDSTNSKSETLYFQTNCPDGRIEFRVEILNVNSRGQTNLTTTLKNGDGLWLLVNGKAIKSEFFGVELAAFNQSLASIPPPEKDRIKSTMETVTLNNIPCYLITESMDLTLADSTEALIKNSRLFDNIGIDLDKMFPVKRQYYIGTNNFFIYSTQTFNKNNLKTSEITFSHVKINPLLAKNIFSVPEGTQIIIVHSIKEYVDGLMIVYGAGAGTVNKPPSAMARYTVLTIAVGSALFTAFVLYRDGSSKKTG